MPRTPRNPLEAGARASRAPKPRQQRQPRQRQLPPPPPPTTKHWSEGAKQTLDFGPPVQFEDDWRPAPPIPAQQLLIYPGSAQNGFGGQTTPAGYTAPQQQPYQQAQGSENPFAALPQQQYYPGQYTQVPFAAHMQPQNTGVYQPQATSAALTQQQQYPPFSGPPYLGQTYQSPYAAPPQQQQYPPFSGLPYPGQAYQSPYAAPSQQQQQQQQTLSPPQEVSATPSQERQQQQQTPPPSQELTLLSLAAPSQQPPAPTAMFDMESPSEILSRSEINALLDATYDSPAFKPSPDLSLDIDAILESALRDNRVWDEATKTWDWP